MFNLQGSEIIVILLLALVVLGPEKLPDAIRKFSQTYAELKKMGSGFQSELKSAMDEPMREMRETANLIQDAADPKKMVAQAEADAAKQADAAKPAEADPETDDRPYGDTNPGSTVADSDEMATPINQIAAANASSALRPTPEPEAAADSDDPDAEQPADVPRPAGPAFHSAAPPIVNNTDTDAAAASTGDEAAAEPDVGAPAMHEEPNDAEAMVTEAEDANAP